MGEGVSEVELKPTTVATLGTKLVLGPELGRCLSAAIGYDRAMLGDDSVTRIAMWSGPRNLSTALLRSWENRPDSAVIDEPLYPWHLARTGMDHPLREEVLAVGPTDLADAIDRCLAPQPPGVTVSYQKHMSAHLPPAGVTPTASEGWLDHLTHGLLLRNPLRMLRSYARKWDEMPLTETGLPQQLELLDRAVVVVDSDDILTDPRRYLAALCDAFEVPFWPEMLSWPAGRRDSDGVWGQVWYDAVIESTTFGGPPGPAPLIDDLPSGVRPIAEEALEIHAELAAHRLML